MKFHFTDLTFFMRIKLREGFICVVDKMKLRRACFPSHILEILMPFFVLVLSKYSICIRREKIEEYFFIIPR